MKTFILFSHGKGSPEGELTLHDRRNIWSTALQVLQNIGQSDLNKAAFFSSSSMKAKQTARIVLTAFGLYSRSSDILPELYSYSELSNTTVNIIKEVMIAVPSNVVCAFACNELFQKMAQELCPREQEYDLAPCEAFICRFSDGIGEVSILTVSP